MRAKIKDNSNLQDEDLDVRGRPKRTVVSFQCDYSLWNEFDQEIESTYGKYKKSAVIESLIRQYMDKPKKLKF